MKANTNTDPEPDVPDDPTLDDALAGALTTWRFFEQAGLDDRANDARELYYGVVQDTSDEEWVTDEDETWKNKPFEDVDSP